MSDIINPFKEVKKDWAKKSQERIISAKIDNKEEKIENISASVKEKPASEKNNKAKIRVAKSFKIYPGKLSRDFDKRVNKLQVKFDDLGFDKNYVDSGKYMMFLMALAEKYELYDLYSEVDENGEFFINKDEIAKKFT